MESSENSSPENGDYSAAIPLEISHDVASRADDLLREFAEDSGLETALIVDRSGSLVAGISAEAEVTIEVISALVAGASGAMRALVSQLGETGAMESLHLGGERMIYLREIVNRFILVGVADATRPAGLVRSKAHAIEGELTTLLRDIHPAEVPLPAPSGSSPRSLREVALRRAAERLAPVEAVEAEPEYSAPASFIDEEEEEFEIEPIFESDPIFEAEPLEEPEPELLEEPEPEPEPEVVVEAQPVEPREVLEPLDFGEPEIVIEPAIPMIPPFTKRPLPVDSPFEVEMDEADDDEDEEGIEMEVGDDDEDDTAPLIPPAASVFELEAGDDDEDDDDDEVTAFFEEKIPQDDTDLIEPVPPASFFELLEDDEDDDEEAEDDDEAEEKSAPPVFEFDEFDDFDEDDDGDEEASDESETPGVFDNDEDSDPFPVTARPGDSLFERPEEPDDEAGDEVGDEAGAEDESSADDEGIAEEIREMIDEEEEESEVRSSGPFYF